MPSRPIPGGCPSSFRVSSLRCATRHRMIVPDGRPQRFVTRRRPPRPGDIYAIVQDFFGRRAVNFRQSTRREFSDLRHLLPMVVHDVSADPHECATLRWRILQEARHDTNPDPSPRPHPGVGVGCRRPSRHRPGCPVLRDHLGLTAKVPLRTRPRDGQRHPRRPARLLRPHGRRSRRPGRPVRLLRRPVRAPGVRGRLGRPRAGARRRRPAGRPAGAGLRPAREPHLPPAQPA